MARKYEVINDRYGNEMTPQDFHTLSRQVADVFQGMRLAEVQTREHGWTVVDEHGEVVAREVI